MSIIFVREISPGQYSQTELSQSGVSRVFLVKFSTPSQQNQFLALSASTETMSIPSVGDTFPGNSSLTAKRKSASTVIDSSLTLFHVTVEYDDTLIIINSHPEKEKLPWEKEIQVSLQSESVSRILEKDFDPAGPKEVKATNGVKFDPPVDYDALLVVINVLFSCKASALTTAKIIELLHLSNCVNSSDFTIPTTGWTFGAQIALFKGLNITKQWIRETGETVDTPYYDVAITFLLDLTTTKYTAIDGSDMSVSTKHRKFVANLGYKQLVNGVLSHITIPSDDQNGNISTNEPLPLDGDGKLCTNVRHIVFYPYEVKDFTSLSNIIEHRG